MFWFHYKKAIARVHVILIGILYIIMFSAYLCFTMFCTLLGLLSFGYCDY